MNPRKRFINAMKRKPVDRIPKHAWYTQEIIDLVKEKTGSEDPDEYFKTDIRLLSLSPMTYNPGFDEYFKEILGKKFEKMSFWEELGSRKHGKYTIDEWGVGHEHGDYYHYSKYVHLMEDLETVDDLKKWPWPVLKDEGYYTDLENRVNKYKNRNIATFSYLGCLFEQAWYLRGMEKLFMDLYFNKKFAQYLLDKLVELNIESAIKNASTGVDAIYTGDDIATQNDLMMSSEMWRKWFKKGYKNIIDEAKRSRPDVMVMFHSDGNNYKIIPDLIEVGCDALHPIQPECMDPLKIYKEFGKDVTIWGTIGTQKLLPFGTPEEIKKEVKKIILEFDAFSGGLVIAPTHYLEPDVPWENIAAFFDAVEEINDRYGSGKQ